MMFVWLGVPPWWFSSPEGKHWVFIRSYVIDSAHLQYQCSTAEGGVVQVNLQAVGELNAWRISEEEFWCFDTEIWHWSDVFFYPHFTPLKLKCKLHFSSTHILFMNTSLLNVLAQFQGPNVSCCWWHTRWWWFLCSWSGFLHDCVVHMRCASVRVCVCVYHCCRVFSIGRACE